MGIPWKYPLVNGDITMEPHHFYWETGKPQYFNGHFQ